MTKGKFIVLYGINNLGKTTQAKLLVKKLNSSGYKAEYLKYPIYDIHPSGTIINDYLRQGNPYNLSPREVQIMYTLNRTQFEPTLKQKLDSNIHIVAEDYIGTGLCWGIGADVDEDFMKLINLHLLKEDISFLFAGKRFTEATEDSHKHETDEQLLNQVDEVHKRLGTEFGWIKINANLSIEIIHNKIWKTVKPQLGP